MENSQILLIIALVALIIALTALIGGYIIYTKLPRLKNGERIVKIPENQSNISLLVKGNELLMVDEKGEVIKIKEIVR